MENEIEVRERNYQRVSKGRVHISSDRAVVTHEQDCLLWLKRMEKLSMRIAHRNETATRAVKRRTLSGLVIGVTHELTSLGEAVWGLCREGIPLIEMKCPSSRHKGVHSSPVLPLSVIDELAHTEPMPVQFNPFITVILRACQRAIPTLRAYGDNSHTLNVTNEQVRHKLHWVVRFVRRVAHTARFKQIESNRIRLEKQNFEHCCQYMASAFAEYSKLLVLRVDLYIRQTENTWADTRLAEQCMERYLRALDEGRIVPDVKRRIWKRECGFDRGIHYHLLVALDGHKHQSAGALTKLLGDTWVERCGPLRASYFNCYVRRHEYLYNGLGSVHISDWKMLMGIRYAIRYVVKGDGYVMTGFTRNLRKGDTPKDKSQPKRGAPRKDGHDMWLVNAVLGNPMTKKNLKLPAPVAKSINAPGYKMRLDSRGDRPSINQQHKRPHLS
ncbi:hypothetical protein GCM10011408_39910 [Dyella caseinilytica]|nr:hypothetical protein GCM10011408_39910 [Dyella caseinilytica]